ncbi:acylphosphatase [Methanosalsum zhilinae DSM 4017]|uniref:Acylphosphatase n=2 Tax=Methanosalsum zhilinae TaxID=39669 RepID=F7XPU8_METZD|nr:acylphosphatase [Methanosalsum zhilinae DSM 4017]
MDACIEAYVSGRVQGVFFRQFTKDTATSLELKGYVKNLADGRVKVVARGDPESIEKLLNRLHEGPAMASVEGVNYRWVTECEEFRDFDIRR